jgi:hypothetical protein
MTPLELSATPWGCALAGELLNRRHVMRIMFPLVVLAALIPISASAITVQEVVALSKAGVSDEVVVALIEQDSTIFPIDASQAIALKREGVSERVVLTMLRSGRQMPPPPPPPNVAVEAPPAPPTEPSLLVVGHGPDRPNTYHSFDQLEGFPPTVVYTIPYAPFVPGISAGCRPKGRTSPGQGKGTTKTSGLREASAKFVNSTLLPMLNESEPVAANCHPSVPPNGNGRYGHR